MTIKFKQGHNGSQHLDEKELSGIEAGYFVEFLEEEIQRHKMAIRQCDYLKRYFSGIPVLVEAYNSSIIGHLHDIKMTKQTVDYLRDKFKMVI